MKYAGSLTWDQYGQAGALYSSPYGSFDYSGDGSLTVAPFAPVYILPSPLLWDGDGSMTATGYRYCIASAAFDADGSLVGTCRYTANPTLTWYGDTTVSIDTIVVLLASADLAGDGDMTTVSVCTFRPTVPLTSEQYFYVLNTGFIRNTSANFLVESEMQLNQKAVYALAADFIATAEVEFDVRKVIDAVIAYRTVTVDESLPRSVPVEDVGSRVITA